MVRVDQRSVWTSDANEQGLCTYLAVLRLDAAGVSEAVSAQATSDPGSGLSDLCEETAQTLVLFLGPAGLR